jgi:hypothetical protein
MAPLGDFRSPDRQYPRWQMFVIFSAILAIAFSVATRTSVPTGTHGTTIQSSVPQAMRQHLAGDAFHWVSPVPVLTLLQVPTFYPRVAPAGPPLPSVLLDHSIYNRPPPSC